MNLQAARQTLRSALPLLIVVVVLGIAGYRLRFAPVQVRAGQKTVPFRPFQIKFCDGQRWTVQRPEQLIVSPKVLIFGEGILTNGGYEAISKIGIEWIGGVDVLPGETKQS